MINPDEIIIQVNSPPNPRRKTPEVYVSNETKNQLRREKIKAVIIYTEDRKTGIRTLAGIEYIYDRVPVGAGIRSAIIGRDKCCVHCKSTQKLVVDHIIPVSSGGTNDYENLQCLCHFCNSIKGRRSDHLLKSGELHLKKIK